MKKYFFAAIVLFLFVYSYENDLLRNVKNKPQQVKKADELPKEKKPTKKKKPMAFKKETSSWHCGVRVPPWIFLKMAI
jgi:hypothetical protein